MKEHLVKLGWALVGVAVFPVAKMVVTGLVSLVNKSPQKEDNDFIVALAEAILKNRKDGTV